MRSAIRLDDNSVALILQSGLGGNAKEFRVVHQSSWIFCFSVSSKNTGLMIRRMDKFIAKTLPCFSPFGKMVVLIMLRKRRNEIKNKSLSGILSPGSLNVCLLK